MPAAWIRTHSEVLAIWNQVPIHAIAVATKLLVPIMKPSCMLLQSSKASPGRHPPPSEDSSQASDKELPISPVVLCRTNPKRITDTRKHATRLKYPVRTTGRKRRRSCLFAQVPPMIVAHRTVAETHHVIPMVATISSASNRVSLRGVMVFSLIRITGFSVISRPHKVRGELVQCE